MSKRKLFQNLSKSQKNRRIKKEYDSFLEIPSSSPWQSKKSSMENVIIEEGNTENVELCSNLKIMRSENEKCNSSGEISSVKKDIKDNNTLDSNNDMLMEDNAILEPFNISENNSNALKEELTRWICQYNIAHLAAGALLKILRNVQSIEELKELPQDPRTLLNTPRSTVIRLVSPGEYFHYGLQQGLIDQLKVMNKNKLAENIQINVHIDGLPLAKSSKSQLYPILAEIFPKITAPFVVEIYHGYSKPHSVNEYLQEFIEEYNTLQKEGFQYDDRTFHVIIRAVICDSPARSFVTCTKSHNGFFGCSKCMQEGEFEDHRMLFLEMDAPLRTDNNFLQRKNEDHHTGKSIFEASNIGMVSQFPVEYMHLVCLGVEKKILHLWVNGWRISNKKQIKFSAKIINKISKYLISIRNWIPSEFVRKTRSLDELDRWKATELRLFLLYVGPLALKNHQPDEYLYHFNSLHCAIRLLCDETDCIRNNQCANNLLRYFVEQSINLYGKRFVIYNVHNLIHLADDVKRFGHLDSFSAFSFKSYLNKIKKNLKKGEKPLQQLHKRLVEQASSSSLRRNCVFIKPEVSNYNAEKSKEIAMPSYDKIKYKKFTLSARLTCDKFCYIRKYDILRIENVCIKNNEIILQGQTLTDIKSVDNYPINSELIHIVIGNKWSILKDFCACDVISKAVCLPYDNSFYFFPLLHSSI